MTRKGKAIVINDRDNVATALTPLEKDATLLIEHGSKREEITIRSAVPAGHKFALCEIGPGEYVIKYGEPIGTALVRISPGEHVHVHNIRSAGKTDGGQS